jgi:hypothetical protein
MGDRKYLTMTIELLRYLYIQLDFKGHRLPPYSAVVAEASDELAQLVIAPLQEAAP